MNHGADSSNSDAKPGPLQRSPGAVRPHPRGLYYLFFAEAWERFSYYGMRALLVLYLVNRLGYQRADALSIYGTYTGLVYLTPYLGGILADRYLGRRKGVFIGGILMMLGHLAMAFEPLLFPALGLLVLGNGLFKPNISTIVGGLYEQGDERRDGGFTIFYMGINLGAFFSPIVCGNLGEHVGWHYGFSSAAIGMAAGLVVFHFGQRFLGNVGLPPARVPEAAVSPDAPAQGLLRRDWLEIAAYVVVSTVLVFVVLHGWPRFVAPIWDAIPWLLKAALGAALLVAPLIGKRLASEEIHRIVVIFVLCFFNIFFWMGFEQAGGTMTLFADKETDRTLSGAGVVLVGLIVAAGGYNVWASGKADIRGRGLWLGLMAMFVAGGLAIAGYGASLLLRGTSMEIAASQFQAINPLLIVVLAPSFSLLWSRLDRGRLATSAAQKMALGMVILGLGFVVMYAGQLLAAKTGRVGPQWLAIVYAIHTIGELALSPVGLSMVTKLAPARVVSFLMGIWLLSSSAANKLAGELEHMVSEYHWPVYGVLIATSIGAGVVLFALSPLLKRWTHGAEEVVRAG